MDEIRKIVTVKSLVFDILRENPNLTIRQLIDTLPKQNVNSVRYYYYDYKTRQNKPKQKRLFKQIVRKCPECKKPFKPSTTKQIYCSKKCQYEYNRKHKKPTLKCKKCGKLVHNLTKKGYCADCEFSFGTVWLLNMTTWEWSLKPTPTTLNTKH